MEIAEDIGVWQQAAGDGDRNYVDVCLRWGVILNGPGEYGPLPDKKNEYAEKIGPKKLNELLCFATKLAEGDIVVLRLGTQQVFAVGQVVGDYLWTEDFGDVDGWTLQHVRRVRWLWSAPQEPRRFPAYALKQGLTTQKLAREGEAWHWLNQLEVPEDAYLRPVPSLPTVHYREVDQADIGTFLYQQGIPSQTIRNLTEQLGELIWIANWYAKSETAPSEHETVCYLAVPLLRALGWTPQKMAIETEGIDVALFNRLPRDGQSLVGVVEAKRKGNACLTAFDQAARYAARHANCRKVIVTDGIRYGVFVRTDDTFNLRAYLNLTRLAHEYPLYECLGAAEAFLAMTPDWNE